MTDLLDYARRLRANFSRDTSELPEQWNIGNPSIGQCHVSALLMQEKFGGTIMVGDAQTDDGPVEHYWPVIDGITIDPTHDQFEPTVAITDIGYASPPNQTTIRKAQILRERLA